MSETPEPVGTEAPQATGLTLETYAPHPLVEAAIEAAGYQISAIGRHNGPVSAINAIAPILIVVSAVALADLVEQGVAPYAEAPGVVSESDQAAAEALSEWASDRVARAGIIDLLGHMKRRGTRTDTTIIAFLRDL